MSLVENNTQEEMILETTVEGVVEGAEVAPRGVKRPLPSSSSSSSASDSEDDEGGEQPQTKPPKKKRNINSGKYWKIETIEPASPEMLSAVNDIDNVSKTIPLIDNSFGVQFKKSVSEEQIKTLLTETIAVEYGTITNVKYSTFNQLERTGEPLKKKRSNNGNNNYRYWQIRIEAAAAENVTQAVLDAIVEGNDTVIKAILLPEGEGIGLQFNKSVSSQQAKNIVQAADIEFGQVAHMKCNLFHKMEKADESSNSSGESPKVKKVRRNKSQPTNSYYTFTMIGDSLQERIDNAIKVIEMSPVKRPFSNSAAAAEEDTTTTTTTSTGVVNPRGIKDIHFFDSSISKGCFTVRNIVAANGEVPQEEFVSELYTNLLKVEEKVDHPTFKKLIHDRTMNRHIKAWYCICPYYTTGGVPPAADKVSAKGIATYRIYEDRTGVFQFDGAHTSTTPAQAAEATGAIHKSMLFQSPGTDIQKFLDAKKAEGLEPISSGEIVYRSKWSPNDSRATRCFKFYSSSDEKMNIADVLSIVHTDGLFSSVHFRKDTMEYGVAKSKSKIIPKTIKIKKGGDTFHSEEDIEVPVKFTAITSEELNRECNTKGMNSLRAHKKRKSNSSTTTTSTTSTSTTANTPKKTKKSASAASDPFAKLTLDYVDSTSFVFYNISKEMVQRILAQERVKTLKAVKNEEKMEIVEGEEAQETYRGIVKIKTNAKAYNLANKTSGVLFPADKVCLKHTLEDLGDVLDFDVVREDNVNKTVASTTTTSSENKASGGDDEETPMEFETDGEKLLHELLNE
ncbi:ORF135 [White spot syndrome virus]|uniref:Wsv277 n=6 Tax=White spot syndrome virus TaxID=342409 RepID=Q77J36_WSSVS|nr:wsv277 [Shrimp white spot syndrome virus]YP_009220569.1 hypothetical protein SWSSV_gp095 [White spot syndrome virus]AYW76589.1 hypothetical protein [Procambarus clarkii virus]AAK77804.1 ORF135 [White spot syndrome virus]AAL33280.1 wsv277 [Shrimp white spot syndrome virus]AAL89200.1 WSSV332 [Shrimp white spot syndrome virus]AFX59651.1 wsv277 [White spot syndrome virus]